MNNIGQPKIFLLDITFCIFRKETLNSYLVSRIYALQSVCLLGCWVIIVHQKITQKLDSESEEIDGRGRHQKQKGAAEVRKIVRQTSREGKRERNLLSKRKKESSCVGC